jgi:predicted glycoside hydrolase/deacetylase ChbG (UPF0249 family)
MKLIVNGDDFGYSKEINKNIIKCHNDGILTSTTLIAYGEGFDEAVEMAKSHLQLGVGVHLILDGEFKLTKTPVSLIDPETGYFYKYHDTIKRIKNGLFTHDDLVKEYSCQIEKILNAGIKVTHIDHHHHLHMYFPILNAVIEVSKKYNIQYIRPQKIISLDKMSFYKKVYRELHHFYLRKRCKSIDGYFGLFSSSKYIMRKKFEYALKSNKKVVELMVHPSDNNGEIDFLTDKNIIDLCNNKLVNYSNL